MTRTVCLFAFFAFVTMKAISQPCRPELTIAYIDSTEAIFIARVSFLDYKNNVIFFNPKKIYKGFIKDDFYIVMDSIYSFEQGEEYLVYATQKRRPSWLLFEINFCSRTARLNESKEDISFLDKTINCKGPKRGGVCSREWTPPVCGCDGVSYGGACEASQRGGVYVYTFGNCQK
jgi:hypothetical protein